MDIDSKVRKYMNTEDSVPPGSLTRFANLAILEEVRNKSFWDGLNLI